MFIVRFILVMSIIACAAFFDNMDRKSSINNNIISLQNKSKFDKLDVLFVGSSYSYSGIKPSLLDSEGLSSYNLGIVSAGIEFYELIVDDYLENIKYPPKKIFILISPMTFSSWADNYSEYPIHRYLENPKSNIEVIIKYNHFSEFNSFFIRSIKKGIQNIFSINSNLPNRPIASRGYVHSNRVMSLSETKTRGYNYIPLIKENFINTRSSYLEEFVSKLEAKGIEVFYFELPTNRLRDYFNQYYLETYDLYIDNLSKSDNFLKINETLFTDRNFRNIDHMNDSGAEIATKEIINYLGNR